MSRAKCLLNLSLMQRFGAQSFGDSLEQSISAQASCFLTGFRFSKTARGGRERKRAESVKSTLAQTCWLAGLCWGVRAGLCQNSSSLTELSCEASVWARRGQACRLHLWDFSQFTARLMWPWTTSGDRGWSWLQKRSNPQEKCQGTNTVHMVWSVKLTIKMSQKSFPNFLFRFEISDHHSMFLYPYPAHSCYCLQLRLPLNSHIHRDNSQSDSVKSTRAHWTSGVGIFWIQQYNNYSTGSPQSVERRAEMCSLTKAVKPLQIDWLGLLLALYTHTHHAVGHCSLSPIHAWTHPDENTHITASWATADR